MTGDELRARRSVNGITQPVVILTIPERDALADLIDAAGDYDGWEDPAGEHRVDPESEQEQEQVRWCEACVAVWPCPSERIRLALTALDQEANERTSRAHPAHCECWDCARIPTPPAATGQEAPT